MARKAIRASGPFGQVGDDAVALRDAEGVEALPDGGDLLAELAPAELRELAQLRGVDDGDLVVGLAAEDVLGVVELGAGEPVGARHDALVEHDIWRGVLELALVLAGRNHLEVVPDACRQNSSISVIDQRQSAW